MSLPIFAGVEAALLERVKSSGVRHYIDGDVILRQDDSDRSTIVILEGTVRLESKGIYLVTRGAPQIVGEQALLDDVPRSADAIAQGVVEALILPEELGRPLLRDPAFMANLARSLSSKLRESTGERTRRYRIEELVVAEFRAHLSPEILEELLSRGENFGAPKRINAVILFSDIRDFTKTSAVMDPVQLAAELDSYFSEMVDVIHRYGGLIDKFIGDAVMAIWGYTADDPMYSTAALSAAVDMIEMGRSMRLNGQPIQIGVGLNYGPVFIGNVGGDVKRQFTVLGTPVNLASRFQDACKTLGKPLVVGPAIFSLLPEDLQLRFQSHANQLVKGSEPLTLYSFDVP